MIYYVMLPIFSLALIVFQTTILDLFFLGKMGFEVSLILVVYAGLHLDVMKGGILAFVLGFFLDCITGSMTGFFIFIYVAIFFLSKVVSSRVYPEEIAFIMGFTFLCVFSKGIITILIYYFIYDVDLSHNILRIFLPQALVAGVLSPALFPIFDRLEVLLDAQSSG
jgi:rod shape-determining protein MreD